MSQNREFSRGIINSGASGIPRESTYPSWSNSRGNYRRRAPEQTCLYRLIHHYRAEFEHRYEELFQEDYGELRSVVLETFDAYLSCGILRHGCALACCENCSHSISVNPEQPYLEIPKSHKLFSSRYVGKVVTSNFGVNFGVRLLQF